MLRADGLQLHQDRVGLRVELVGSCDAQCLLKAVHPEHRLVHGGLRRGVPSTNLLAPNLELAFTIQATHAHLSDTVEQARLVTESCGGGIKESVDLGTVGGEIHQRA